MSETVVDAPIPAAWVSDECEQCVLGSILLDPSVIDSVASKLDSRDFHDRSFGRFYEFLLDMHELNEPIADIAFLKNRLKSSPLWQELGGAATIGKMVASVPNAGNAAYYAREVRECSDRRKLADMFARFYDQLQDRDISPRDALKRLDAQVSAIGIDAGSDAVKISSASAEAIQRVRNGMQQKHAVGVPTGLHSVDELIGGMFPGELVVIAARPSIGKSALGSQIAYSAASHGRVSLFVSLEMETWELAGRTLSHETGIDGRYIRAATITEEQLSQLENAAQYLDSVPYYLWRPNRATVSDIRAKARVMAATIGLGLLVVDYLSLIRPADPRAFRRDQFSQIGKDLKALANELEIPVVALAQLNRESEGNEPKLSHLAESGTIEQDANSVWLLHRDNRAAKEAWLMIEKSRGGVVTRVRLGYVPEHTRFEDFNEFS